MHLADVVAEVIGDERPTDIQHYAKRPLRTAARFGTLDASAIDDFLTPLVEQDRALATSLLLALPKRLTAIDGPDRRAPLDGAAVAAVLASATAEIRAQAEATPAILSPAAWLVRRACTVDDLPASAAAPLVDLVGHIAKAQQEPRVPAVEAAAHTLSRLLPKLSRHEGQPLDLDKVARAVAQLPLTPEGGRAALVAAIGKVRPESVVGEAWWSGVTLNELAGCATGILGGVTSRPAVAERVIRPLVIKELSAVSSRTRLGFLLGLPREFAAQFPVDALAAAFRRIAAEDQVVAGWVNALAQNDRVNAFWPTAAIGWRRP